MYLNLMKMKQMHEFFSSKYYRTIYPNFFLPCNFLIPPFITDSKQGPSKTHHWKWSHQRRLDGKREIAANKGCRALRRAGLLVTTCNPWDWSPHGGSIWISQIWKCNNFLWQCWLKVFKMPCSLNNNPNFCNSWTNGFLWNFLICSVNKSTSRPNIK